MHFSIILFIKAHVSRAESERVWVGPERHVFLFAGLRIRGQPQVEICERGVGPRGEARTPNPQLRVHPPRLSKLRSALDESSSLL